MFNVAQEFGVRAEATEKLFGKLALVDRATAALTNELTLEEVSELSQVAFQHHVCTWLDTEGYSELVAQYTDICRHRESPRPDQPRLLELVGGIMEEV